MQLIDLVRQTIRQHDLARPGTRVLVALSGGADSVALTHLLRELDAAGECRVAGLAHFNHQLRATAARDEQFCVSLAESLRLHLVTGGDDVAARAHREHRSIEDAARTARHEFLERVRAQLGADLVALGHTRDDQAETFLLRLLRGAGPRGLSAMHPRNGCVIRPLIECRRRDLRTYLGERRVSFVEDESNQDVAIPRNRVRAELMPLLEARFNPRIVDVLAGEAELARGEWHWMEMAAEELASSAVSSAGPDVFEIDVAAVIAAPLALRRLVIWRAMSAAAHGRAVTFDHVNAVLGLLEPSAASSGLDAPGQRVQRTGSRLVLRGRPAGAIGRPAAQPANLFSYPLSVPGEVRLIEAGCVVTAESRPGLPANAASPSTLAKPANSASAASAAFAIVRSDACSGSLSVRNRRPGDRFRPVGVGGQKTLQDFFVDRKVARPLRDAVPIVVDGANRIVWVAGYGIDEEFRVTDPTQAVVILRLKLLGGSA